MIIKICFASLGLLLAALTVSVTVAEAKVLAARSFQEYYVVDKESDYLPMLRNPKTKRLVRSIAVDAPTAGDYLFTLSATCSSSIDTYADYRKARLAGLGVEVFVSTPFTTPVLQPASNANTDVFCGNDGDNTPLSGMLVETLTIPIKLTKGRNMISIRSQQTSETKWTLFSRIAVTIND